MLKKCDRDCAGVPWFAAKCEPLKRFHIGPLHSGGRSLRLWQSTARGGVGAAAGAIGGSDLAEMTE
jgi:hypothetical protein